MHNKRRHVQELENIKSGYYNDILEVYKMINKISTDLKRLEKYNNDDQDIKQQKKPTGWLLYLASLFYRRQIEETAEQQKKQARELETFQKKKKIYQ